MTNEKKKQTNANLLLNGWAVPLEQGVQAVEQCHAKTTFINTVKEGEGRSSAKPEKKKKKKTDEHATTLTFSRRVAGDCGRKLAMIARQNTTSGLQQRDPAAGF
jgi:hypothetical protein